ncbi:MAG: isochorismate synthase [candidate division Zixibacteria bacterium]|nr:isochorismate synthase [candidate division Zixibacteria bacterium]
MKASNDAALRLADTVGTLDVKAAPTKKLVLRAVIEIDDADPLDWLSARQQHHKIYWRSRDTEYETAGVGAAAVYYLNGPDRFQKVFDHLNEYTLESDSVNFFGGFSFQSNRDRANEDEGWHQFYDAYFFLPRFELCRTGDKTELAANLLIDPSRPEEIKNVVTQLNLGAISGEKTALNPSMMVGRRDFPDRDGWLDLIKKVEKLFQKGDLQKIVLARRSALDFDRPFCPWNLLKKLKKQARNNYLFGLQVSDGTAFIGASPERLYLRQGLSLKTEALAGTRPRGKTDQDDIALREELLNSEKEQREHQFVLDFILDNLINLCESIKTGGQTSIFKLERVQHLYNRIEAVLKQGVTDSELMAALHPTPAVGGQPRKEALEILSGLEPFQRGWYAAPVGRVGRDSTEFAVAIRSALVREKQVNLYAGAGIVEGSVTENEWQELENKISGFTNLFKG